jgi:AcrR family transcriptional regulator
MPKISDAYRESQRRRILEAARVCFSRNGFHQTSVDDILAEAGMSAGALYVYYPGKGAIISEIASEVIGSIRAEIAELLAEDPTPPLRVSLRRIVTALDRLITDGAAGLALQVWGEAQRDPTLAALARREFTSLREQLESLLVRTGPPTPDRDSARRMSTTMFSLLPGYLVEKILIGDVGPDDFVEGVLDMGSLIAGAPAGQS